MFSLRPGRGKNEADRPGETRRNHLALSVTEFRERITRAEERMNRFEAH